MNVLFVALCFVVVSEDVAVFGNKHILSHIDSVRQEEPCSRAGGMCVIASDCPSGKLTPESGLCPAQQSNLIECCYGRSVKDTSCSRVGICRPMSETCHPRLVTFASDCPENTRCCVLVG